MFQVVVHRYWQQESYWRANITFLECPSISDSKYWTPLEMNPATFAHTSHSIQDLKTASGDMLFCAFSHAYTAISETANRWKKMLECFGQFIGDKLAFLDPEYHDKLLSDDEVLSRSKKYFWAVSALKGFRTSISRNILQIKQLLEQETSEITTEEGLEGLRRVRAMLCSELRKIENIASKLETKQEEATYFRDGSTWNIDASFDYLNLLLAVNILAAATYFLGYNAH
ncbi:uncharacterized protein EAF02_001068 [Botrytis sinoallii]|uniref:uncharacterized protein n=1 Tax=Botrytis sinoallii TaxID=1463999 RepID=UPI001901DE1F|nr:uncharacterized protein EAF02_001068 [Botrytis sinoallii]KAF7893530.1 hypothetical protein EAF02_001068 [Botrytis sinoallii]